MRRLTPLVITVIVAAAALIVFVGIQSHVRGQVGMLTISTDSSSEGATISIKGDQPIVKKSRGDQSFIYTLKPGDYQLSITHANYKPLTSDFSVHVGDSLQATGHLSLVHQPNLASAEEVPDLTGNGYTLSGVQYFYDKLWAVIQITQPGTDPAYCTVNFDVASGKWKLVNGPGTEFSDDDLKSLPPNVKEYLSNRVVGGSV